LTTADREETAHDGCGPAPPLPNVIVGALVLGGAITSSADVDRHALRWHVFVWDMWFLVWGLAPAVAVAAVRRL
jgi:hypothetical protein